MQDATPSNDACRSIELHKLIQLYEVGHIAVLVALYISECSNVAYVIVGASMIDTERVVVGTHASTPISKVTEKVDVEALFTVWRQSREAASDFCFLFSGILL
jgi:hypothetical protein